MSADKTEIAGPVIKAEIHLVRHGHHPEGFRGGWSVHSLSDIGRAQSLLLTERLRQGGIKVDTLIASDLPRARETADIVARALRISVLLTEDWREVNNGVLAGMLEDQAQALYPGLYWSSLEMNQAYPGGESPAAFRQRIESAFRSLCERIHKGSVGPNVMVITHGGPIRAVLSLVEGTEWSNRGPQQPVHETSIFTLSYVCGNWCVTRRNDTRHLTCKVKGGGST